ncbi:MAG: SUMF1/EgtB/PvdO family nonheme iron enzyme [Alphaproteobacteria bacterium]|nr:SUMF1/EgtB/PvdO family nonheme iron enzyme [Alphaproteobacteria bacterium]
MNDEQLSAYAEQHGLDEQALAELRELVRPDLSLRTPRTPSARTIDLDFEPEAPEEPEDGPRYQDLGPLGVGGMSEVRRVFDRDLGRVVAMKVLRPELAIHAPARSRFLQEARITARLQHPGILPIYEIGTDEDERLYFTMPVVEGRTLRELLGEPAAERPLRRLMAILQTVCEAVAYAHESGVLHRDLKPSNVMIGAHGSVLVTDWGLATEVERLRERRGRAVVGTPAYMAPEQARGEHARMSPAADVYALGVTLAELLTGEQPFGPLSSEEALGRVLDGERPFELTASEGLPAELVALAHAAMAPDPEARLPHAGALVEGLTAWLDGARKRARARRLVEQARASTPEVNGLQEEAAWLRDEARRGLHETPPWAPIEDKLLWWEREERAVELERAAAELAGESERLLQLALTLSPELPEARRLLADAYRAEHEQAEALADLAGMARAEALLRSHDDGRHATYLRGVGALSLRTDPPGADVELLRYEAHQRRLVPFTLKDLGRTPLEAVELPIGSYLLKLRAPGCSELRYPVRVTREGHWSSSRPGDGGHALRLPRMGVLPQTGLLVPEGWALTGGDPEAFSALPSRRLWIDGFVIQRAPVTNAAWLAFLNALASEGRVDEALEYAPRELGRRYAEPGALLVHHNSEGRFEPHEGSAWAPNVPITMITAQAAQAYARFVREGTGQPWRLPGELEWEKAARGVDGRSFPWGDHLDPTWCQMSLSQPGTGQAVDIERFPLDVSPYGVRGMAGNVRDWCADNWREEGPAVEGERVLRPPLEPELGELRVYRGGYWDGPARDARAASRFRYRPLHRSPSLGVRLVMSWD